MEIEIKAAYFIEKDPKQDIYRGTLNVYIPHIRANLRGVLFKRRNKRWIIQAPFFRDFHNKSQFYPVFIFEDVMEKDAFNTALRRQGTFYLDNLVYSKP